MKSWNLRIEYVIIVLGALVALYVVPGVFYWLKTGPDVARCLWGDAGCSLTVATFLLTLVTACAFVAAFQAAWFAYKTFDTGQKTLDVAAETLRLERTAILGARRCTVEDHPAEIDVVLSHEYKTEKRAPFADEQLFFYEMSYEFASLGRIPIVEAAVVVSFSFNRRIGKTRVRNSVTQSLELGNFKFDGEAHVRIWIAPELLDIVEVTWVRESATHLVEKKNVTLDFHPLGLERPEFRALARYERASGVIPVEVPQAVPAPTPQRATPPT